MVGRIRLLAIVGVLVLPLAVMTGWAAAQAPPQLSDMEALGKAIYFDASLSLNQNQSCASCHAPTAGWVGPSSTVNAHGAVYEGSVPGEFGNRKPPSAAYATQAPNLHMTEPGEFVGGTFWDGRATGERLGSPAAEQAQGPFLNPREQALPDSACVVYRVLTAAYPVSFVSVWGDPEITWPAGVETTCHDPSGHVALSDGDRALVVEAYDNIGMSIAAFEGSAEVNASTSKYDAKVAGTVKFTKEEQKGWSLFRGKADCVRCHVVGGGTALFTDYTYDNLGIPANPENPVYDYDPGFVDPGLGGYLESRADYANFAGENMGKFKVPTLRNVDLRPAVDDVKAFGHNGYFKSLRSIVHFYNTRDVLPRCEGGPSSWVEGEDCWPRPENPMNVNHDELGNLGLSPQQEAALVAFLKTLSDGYEPAA